MVDINTSASALQAQLQANQQTARPGVRTSVSNSSTIVAQRPQDVVSKRIDARQDIATPDRRASARQSDTSKQLSTSAEIDDASRRAAQFSGPSREAPIGRISGAGGDGRNQPLGQIINILV